MHKIEVGKLYTPGRTSWPEMVEWNWRRELNEMRLFFRNPSPQEIQSVKLGKVDFGFTVEQDIIFLLFRFAGAQKGQAGVPWSDAPYSYHMLKEEMKGLPPDLGEYERILLQIVLVNANTGITLAIRMISFSHDFTAALFQAIREQAEKPFDQRSYDRRLQQIYAMYDSKQLQALAIARCEGGK